MGHMSVRHSSKLQSLHSNGIGDDGGDDNDDDDDDGLRLAEVAVGILAVRIRITLHIRIPKKTTDCLYSTGIPLNKLVLLVVIPLGEPLSARILPESLSDRILPFAIAL